MQVEDTPRLKVLSGNVTAAWAVRLCKPDVVAAYPITPQSEIVAELNKFKANGDFDAEMINVEGENSAMGAIVGASQVGARVFTATSSWGLEYMTDIFLWAVRCRLPLVMINANREPTQAGALARGRQDIMLVRDSGWIQLECQNCQEIFDTIIAAYRLAEDPEVLVPVLVSYDGWYISYLIERVEIASQESVNRFLNPVAHVGRLKAVPGYVGEPTWVHGYIEPSNRVPAQGPANRNELRLKHELATERAKDKLEEIAEEFEEVFGRPMVGQIEEYKTNDAEILLVAMGGEAMTARVVVDKKRNEGIKVGLVRIKMFRPCPKKKLTKVFAGKKSIGVLEQGICHGWNTGFLLLDIKAILYDAKVNIPVPNFLAGMSGDDITKEQIEQAIDITYKASIGEDYREVTWLSMPYLYE